jgi:membrane protein required for colicin V production
MTFAFIDVLFLVIVLFISLHAAYQGLVREVFTKAAFILGLAGGLIFCGFLAGYLTFVEQPFLRQTLSFVIIFVGLYLAVRVVQHFVAKVFSGDIMGGLNRALGFLWGVIEGLAVVTVILALLHAQPWFNIDAVFRGSFFDRLLGGPAEALRGWLGRSLG